MLGHVEDAADVEGSVGLVVQDVAGLVVSLRYEAIKLLVLPLTDVLGVQHPQSLWRNRENSSYQLQDLSNTALHSLGMRCGSGTLSQINKLLPLIWPRATPQRKLLPCNIYRAAFFRPTQKGFG